MIVIFLLAPVGAILFYFEFRRDRLNRKILRGATLDILRDNSLSKIQKREQIEKLFRVNRYTILESKDEYIVISKREFSLGLTLMSASLFLVGVLIYLIYYFKIEPKREVIDL